MADNNKGSALVIVTLYTLVLTILGTAIMGVAINEYRMEVAHRNGVKAYYLAEAGLEKAIFEIARMEAIIPETLGDMNWEMENEDLDLVEPGAKGYFSVTVDYVGLHDVIPGGEGEGNEAYNTIYELTLKSMAVYKGTPVGLEARLLVEDYEKTGMDNKVQVCHWRQIRGVEDEN